MFDLSLLKTELHKKGELFLRIKVIPNAPKNEIVEMMSDHETLKVKIKAIPEKDRANKELIKFFVQEFRVKKGESISVLILSGQKQRLKLIKIKL